MVLLYCHQNARDSYINQNSEFLLKIFKFSIPILFFLKDSLTLGDVPTPMEVNKHILFLISIMFRFLRKMEIFLSLLQKLMSEIRIVPFIFDDAIGTSSSSSEEESSSKNENGSEKEKDDFSERSPEKHKNKDEPKTQRKTIENGPQKLANFNDFLKRFDSKTHPQEVLDNIMPVMWDIELFSQIITKNDNEITFIDLNIDDEKFFEFSSLVSSLPEINIQLLNLVNSLSTEILSHKNPTESILRATLIIFYFPAVISPQSAESLLVPLLVHLANFNNATTAYVILNLSKLPKLMNQILGDVHFAISNFFASRPQPDPHCAYIDNILRAMSVIHSANRESAHPLPSSLFYNHHIDEVVDCNVELQLAREQRSFSLLQYPFILSLNTKSNLCQLESKSIMEGAAIRSLLVGLVNGDRLQQSDLFLNLHVRRDHIIDDTLAQLLRLPASDWLKKLRVVFEGESAVDVGGPSREFIYLLSEELFSPDYGMLTVVNKRFLWFSPISFEDNQSFLLYGLIVGLAAYNHILMPIRFPLVMYKKLLGVTEFKLWDLEEIDPVVANSMKQLLEMVDKGEDVADLCLNFEATIDNFGKPMAIPLVPGGSEIEVTNENARKYVDAYIDYILNKSVELPFASFKKGFELVCRAGMYKMLAPDELDIFVSGEEVMDWGALHRFCKYDGYTEDSRAVKWFWSIFDAMPDAERVKFLKFATGTDRAPLGGLGSIKLVIQRGADIHRLPVSHTCFNTFVLPDYKSKDIMKHNLYLAIDNTEGFGFV